MKGTIKMFEKLVKRHQLRTFGIGDLIILVSLLNLIQALIKCNWDKLTLAGIAIFGGYLLMNYACQIGMKE